MSSVSTSVFATDGPLYRSWHRVYELVVIGLGWWLLSLPVITAPVATDWLLCVVDRTARGESVPTVRETLAHLRHRWPVTTGLAAVHLGVLGLIAVALLGPTPGGIYGAAVLVVSTGVAATWALILPWTLVLLSESADTSRPTAVREVIVRAYRRALTRLPASVLAATLSGACLLAPLVLPKMIMLPVLLTLPGAWAALLARILRGPTRTSPPTPPHLALTEPTLSEGTRR